MKNTKIKYNDKYKNIGSNNHSILIWNDNIFVKKIFYDFWYKQTDSNWRFLELKYNYLWTIMC